jgi:glycosyltransferase involved in cell wall biosynthesis
LSSLDLRGEPPSATEAPATLQRPHAGHSNGESPAVGRGARLVGRRLEARLAGADDLDYVFARRVPEIVRRSVGRHTFGRACLVAWATRPYDAVVLERYDRVTAPLLWVNAVLGRRKLIILDFIEPRSPRSLIRSVLRAAKDCLRGWAVRRSLLAAHVLTEWERHVYAQRYGVPIGRFRYVHYPMSMPGGVPTGVDRSSLDPEPDVAPSTVMISGRGTCDWETALRALSGTPWRVITVSDSNEIETVRQLARKHGLLAEHHCDLPTAEHWRLLRRATVYLLPLRETWASSGHVRIRTALQAGVPLVVTDVCALDGYVIAGRTALTVPHDRTAMREAVAKLMSSPTERDMLVANARDLAERFPWPGYLESVALMLTEACQGARPTIATSSASER